MSRKGGSLGCIWFEETKMKYQDAKAFCEGKNSILFEPSGPEEAREVIEAYQNGKSDTHSFAIPPQKVSQINTAQCHTKLQSFLDFWLVPEASLVLRLYMDPK